MKETLHYIQNLLSQAGLHGITGYIPLIIALLGVMPLLNKLVTRLWKLRQQRKLSKDLHPFYTSMEIKRATQFYVKTKCQNIDPSKDEEPGRTHAFATKGKIIPFFLKKAFKPNGDDCRFYIVLADSGMGKTTFLINLYLKYIDQFFRAQYLIKLFPLGSPDTDREIENIPDDEKKETILLLDALDEDPKATHNYKTRLNDLLKKVNHFREIIITCRTQFFPSEEEEPKETGVLRFGPDGGSHVFRKLYLSPFDDKDIKIYLRKRFSLYDFIKNRKAKLIVEQSPNLMVRPMLLSYIEDLLQRKQKYEAAYMIYEELINRWILREANKLPAGRRKQYQKDLYQFSRAIALNIYQHREEQGGLFIKSEAFNSFADKHNITLKYMEMKSRSLLNRNALGEYKFSHKSVLEYFLAREAFDDEDFRREMNFEGMDQAESFFTELILNELTVPFFNSKDLQGEYSIGNGTRYALANIQAKAIPEITFLKLTSWKESYDILSLRGLKNLKQIEFIESQVTPKHRNDLKYLLPKCEINFLSSLLLRNKPLTVSESEAREVFGLDENMRPLKYIHNQFEDLGVVVVDHTTGLTWEKSGPKKYLNYQGAQKYIKGLKRKKFAGYNDWRLPTVPELMSLLEPERQSNGLFIDPVFDKRQSWCWSADRGSPESAWLVGFSFGGVYRNLLDDDDYVRAVRS